MTGCLEFKNAKCKNCYKCLRNCPVKAIGVIDHQAKIIDDRCILCGKCTQVCPQNAKHVHSEIYKVREFFRQKETVIVTVAPSFVSSFGVDNFTVFKIALGKIGFADAEETAVGARLIAEKYKELLEGGKYQNLITSACPAINRLIQLYYPRALPYLARLDTPVIAHAKLLKKRYPSAKIVFACPCIAKKREAEESGIIDAVLTFEEMQELFNEKNINFDEIANLSIDTEKNAQNKGRFFPINTGIIKTMSKLPENYEYIAADGVSRCMDLLENIDSVKGIFLELNACENGCINGPCSLLKINSSLKANEQIRKYGMKGTPNGNYSAKTKTGDSANDSAALAQSDTNFITEYPRIRTKSVPITERQTTELLAKAGKLKPEDELNCGACGYSTCREKAWAVANGYAEIDMCLPYMRERAETMSYEIIQTSPNGIVVLDNDLKILEMNGSAISILGIDTDNYENRDFADFANPTDFVLAKIDKTPLVRKKIYIQKTKKHAEITIVTLQSHNVMFATIKDITDEVSYDDRLSQVRLDTIATTDEVIKKQMRVAQEIASLLGETTAETKVALLKLKGVLAGSEKKGVS